MSQKYVLHYFNGRGRGELIRLMFVISKTKYEDHRVEFKDWPAFKSKTPNGTLPCLEIDDKLYGQSLALVRFLAKEFSLYGTDNVSQMVVDECMYNVTDLRKVLIDAVFEQDEAKKAEQLKKIKEDALPQFMKRTEEIFKSYGSGGFLVGSKCTAADLALFDIVDGLDSKMKDGLTKKIKEHMAMIGAIKEIKQWLEERPKTEF
ncbi:glutathione S-transferase 1-like [Pecten maximus]|uniref:glutathione S-transferase 1-like n=1 Tax=Pecten maximus TaxID=6579 RepID=UPI00145825A0|nr:glutathione S-transferase 1-like [Pecten maximus]